MILSSSVGVMICDNDVMMKIYGHCITRVFENGETVRSTEHDNIMAIMGRPPISSACQSLPVLLKPKGAYEKEK